MVVYVASLTLFWLAGIAGTALMSRKHHRPLQVNSLTFNEGSSRFSDFTQFDRASGLYVWHGMKFLPYPATMSYAMVWFTRTFQDKPLHRFLLFLGAIFAAAALALAAMLAGSRANRNLLVAAALLSVAAGYPFWFLIERANLEGVVFAVNAAALTAFFFRRYLTAGLLIALATSMKIFPGLLFALLLARKRYRELVWSILFILPLELVSLWLIGPSISQAYADISLGASIVTRNILLTYFENLTDYDHSLFGFIKQVLHVRLQDPVLHARIVALSPWYTALAVVGLAAIYWFRLRKLPLLNQVMVLTIAGVTLPYMSFDYTLTNVFLAWGMFVLYLSRDITEGTGRIGQAAACAILGLFAFLFSPPFYLSYKTHALGGMAQTVALLALGGLALAVPMRSRLFDPDEDAERVPGEKQAYTEAGLH